MPDHDKTPEFPPVKSTETPPKRTRSPNTSAKYFKLGRPSKYDPKFCKRIIDYFTQDLYIERIKSRITSKTGAVCENMELLPNPPKWFGSFAYSIGVTQKTLTEWIKTKADFCLAYTRAKELQHEHIKNLANMGLYNSNFATFTMKNISDWRDKKDLELSGKVDSQIFFAQMLGNSRSALDNEREVIGSLN